MANIDKINIFNDNPIVKDNTKLDISNDTKAICLMLEDLIKAIKENKI